MDIDKLAVETGRIRDVYHELRADLGRAILLGPRCAHREHER